MRNRTVEFENWQTNLMSISYILFKVFYWYIYLSCSGLGQDSSTYLDLQSYAPVRVSTIRDSLKRAGFANATLGALKLLPCPLGTFVNASRLECVECPAGKIYVLLHDYYWNYTCPMGHGWLIQITKRFYLPLNCPRRMSTRWLDINWPCSFFLAFCWLRQ